MSRPDGVPPLLDIHSDKRFMRLHELCDPFTMTPIEVQWALYQAVLYIHEKKIPGNVVECGVWRGGSMLLAATLLRELGDTHRELWLFDTFDGMTEPSDADVNCQGQRGERLWKSEYLKASIGDVMNTMALSGYPPSKIRYVIGDVRETAKNYRAEGNEGIAILRLDTDFYDSTKAELEELYPCLEWSGVLIVDDYGHWGGCRKAVDEYFATHPNKLMLQRVNYSARMGVKA